MIEQKLVDHLFRHQYGKMVSILTRIFGLSNLEIIEDAIQDTFTNALLSWRTAIPDSPEAWLTKAAKNRAIDLLRKVKADNNRIANLNTGPSAMLLNDLFLDHEIEDAQLRMIFTACHPFLNPKDQISFALKTLSGFSIKEISSALLLKDETIKKRLARARKSIKEKSISFEVPSKEKLPLRLSRVCEVIYLIFNEGFHSNSKKFLVRQELCGEALRLCQLLLKKEVYRTPDIYALFALMCFHSARLESKVSDNGEIIDLKSQDRNLWHKPLIDLGKNALLMAVQKDEFSSYYFEAAIAFEHLKAANVDETNWNKILYWYEQLYQFQKSPLTLLNKAIVLLQLKEFSEFDKLLRSLDPQSLEQRVYLYYGAYAEYYQKIESFDLAIEYIEKAIDSVNSEVEKKYLQIKKIKLLKSKG